MKNNGNLLDQLEYAKAAVNACLQSARASVDFHDIVYWAQQVKRLRDELAQL